MGDRGTDGDKRPSSLSTALRMARIEEAERSQVLYDLRDAELARLELLHEMLGPVLAEVPPQAQIFDTGVVPGEHPRYFIDMIAFVEMGRDRRTYRFLQDRRDGRVLLAETDSVAVMLQALTAYIARRIVEREKMLAAVPAEPVEATVPRRPDREPVHSKSAKPRRATRRLVRAVRLLLDGVGLVAVGGLVWLGLHYALGRGLPW